MVLRSPASGTDRAPPVLVGHGGGRHKKHPATTGRAQRLVTGCCFRVAAIDAPDHGERPHTAHDERDIAEPHEAQAADEPEGPVVVRCNAAWRSRYGEGRDRLLGDQPLARGQIIYRRAHDRGEIDLDRVPPSVPAMPSDLMRYDLLMSLEPPEPARIESIVDERGSPPQGVGDGGTLLPPRLLMQSDEECASGRTTLPHLTSYPSVRRGNFVASQAS